MNFTISIIICTRNRFDDFKKTIATMMNQTRLADELVIVDSSDVPQIEEYLNSIKPAVKFRYFHTNPGLTLQRNYGIHESSGDLLFFFDDDVDLDANYLDQVEKVFIEDTRHKIGAVGGRILDPHENAPLSFRKRMDRTVHNLISDIFGLANPGNGKFRFSGMPTHPHSLKNSGYIECLSGCCMAFRREVFEKITFDENLPNYGLMEDVDISKRILDSGYKIYYETSVMLIHNESPKNRLNRSDWAEMTVVNYAYLFHKNWRRNKLRFVFFYWALLGMVILHLRKKDGLSGTLNGLKKIKWI